VTLVCVLCLLRILICSLCVVNVIVFNRACFIACRCEMSAYKRLRVVDLQAQCEARDIPYTGLNKRGLIEALRRYEQNGEQDDGIDGNGMTEGEGEGDGEVTFRETVRPQSRSDNAAGSAAASDVEQQERAESDSVCLMRLKITFAREESERDREREESARQMKELDWRIEKERAELNVGQNAAPVSAVN